MRYVGLQRSIRRVAQVVVAVLCLASPISAWADTPLAPIGGLGGGAFSQRCTANTVLFGLELATGDDVDSVRPICARALASDRVTNDTSEGPFHGGPGPTLRLTCPLVRPVVLGMYVAYEGVKTVIVNNVHLLCGLVSDTDQPLAAAPDAAYDGPNIRPSLGPFASFSTVGKDSQRCPAGQVAIGINGRSGVWLDAVGLVCGASPIVTPPPPGPAVAPAACRALDRELQRQPPGSAAVIATLKVECAKASPPPAACRALVNVLNTNGPTATMQTLYTLCVRGRREQGVL